MTYELIMQEYENLLSIGEIPFFIATVVIGLIFIALVVWRVKSGEEGFYITIQISILAIISFFIWLLVGIIIYYALGIPKSEEAWEKEYVIPYIEQLPKERTELVYVKLDPKYKVSSNGQPSVRSELKTVMVIGYLNQNNEVVTKTSEVKTKMVLGEGETPYLEYQKLDKDFNENYKKGKYNEVIYLPKDYKFSNIQ